MGKQFTPVGVGIWAARADCMYTTWRGQKVVSNVDMVTTLAILVYVVQVGRAVS